MKSCACGKRYEPGDRACLACGRPRGESPAPDPWAPAPADGSGGGQRGSIGARHLATGPALAIARGAPAPSFAPADPPTDSGAPGGALDVTLDGLGDLDGWQDVGTDAPADDAATGPAIALTARRRRRRVAAAGLVAAVFAGAIVTQRSARPAPAVVIGAGIERTIPKAIVRQPSLRWRAAGLARSDQGENYGAGALVAIDDHRLFAVPADGADELHAVDLATGATLWHEALPRRARYIDAVDGLVVVRDGEGIAARDGGNGALRWTSDASFVYQPWPNGPFVTGTTPTGEQMGYRLAAVDPRTGAEQWTVTAGATWLADRQGLVVVNCTDIELRRWTDGSALWTTQLGDQCGSEGAAAQVAAGNAIVSTGDEWRGIDLATGATAWRQQRDATLHQSLEPLDGRHLRLVDHRSSDADRVRVMDASNGELTGAEIDGHFRVVRARTRAGEQLYVTNGSSLRSLDASTYTVGPTSMPVAGSLAVVFGDIALADTATYELSYEAGASRLAAYRLDDGAERWSVDTGSATLLLAIGPVLVLRDGNDLVAYG